MKAPAVSRRLYGFTDSGQDDLPTPPVQLRSPRDCAHAWLVRGGFRFTFHVHISDR